MAGQSNMQGKARVKTIERLTLAGGDKKLYSDMMGVDGRTIVPKGVYEVYFTEGRTGSTVEAGPARPGFGEESDPDDSFGPDYTFGIYMQKHLNELPDHQDRLGRQESLPAVPPPECHRRYDGEG
jgi:alpha-galactosidase